MSLVSRTSFTPVEERPDPRRPSGEQASAVPDAEPHAGAVRLSWRKIAQFATVGIFLILLIAVLELGRAILVPVVSAIVLGLMLGPLSARAARYRIPDVITAIVFWLLVVGILYLIIVTVAGAITELMTNAPEVGRNLKDKLQMFERPMQALRDARNAILPPAKEEAGLTLDLVSVATPALSFLTPAIGQIVTFLGTLFFFLLGRTQIRHMLIVFFEDREMRLRMLRTLNDMERSLTHYLSVIALINLVVGIAAGLIAWFVGLPNPVAWGVLAFILNFVPYIGAFIMQFVLFIVGLLTFETLGHALVAPLIYLAFTTLEGHFITPSIMGKRLFLNPLTVFLALVFWTWLWGPIGAFLAVPILIMMLVAYNHLFPSDDPMLPA